MAYINPFDSPVRFTVSIASKKNGLKKAVKKTITTMSEVGR